MGWGEVEWVSGWEWGVGGEDCEGRGTSGSGRAQAQQGLPATRQPATTGPPPLQHVAGEGSAHAAAAPPRAAQLGTPASRSRRGTARLRRTACLGFTVCPTAVAQRSTARRAHGVLRYAWGATLCLCFKVRLTAVEHATQTRTHGVLRYAMCASTGTGTPEPALRA